MNKGELIAKVSEETGLTQKQVESVVSTLLESIVGQITKGEKVTIAGFGTFEKRHRKARTGRNPQTGAEMQIAASDVPAFSAGKQFKESVKAG